MGKASKWFRGLLGLKSSGTGTGANQSQNPRRKWSFARQDGRKPHRDAGEDDNDASKHAVAVDAATAAVAGAAVAAAQAAAAVVQLTSSGRNISSGGASGSGTAVWGIRSGVEHRGREERAAVTIQSHFRACLARRALRALKALVKLQALVRGHLVRKETAYALRRLQALVRAQVRARAGRVLISESAHSSVKPSHYNYPGPGTPEKFENDVIRARGMKQEEIMMLKRNRSKSSCCVNYAAERSLLSRNWMDNRMGERLWEHGALNRIYSPDDDQSDKILEVDTGHKHAISKRRSLLYSSHRSLGSDKHCQSFSTSKDSTTHCQSLLSPSEVQSLSTMNYAQDVDEPVFFMAENSPTFNSASSRGGSSKRGAFTPAKSDGSRSFLSSYSDNPSYMTCTKSSKAKVRSQSTPKQRPQFERLSSTKRYSVHAYGNLRSAQTGSSLQANLANSTYQGSGHLDRCGMPVRGDSSCRSKLPLEFRF